MADQPEPPTTETMTRTASDRQAVAEGCYYDHREALAVEVFLQGAFVQPDGSGPLKLLRWEREDLIWPLFGWRRPDGTRRFVRVYIEIPKKNGKSFCCGMLVAMFLALARRGDGMYYSAANSREQASLIYGDAKRLIQASPLLSPLFDTVDSGKHIRRLDGVSEYKALSAEARVQDGLRAKVCVMDELHEQSNPKMFGVLRYAGTGQREPVFIMITTAGEYDPENIGWEQHEYARKIISGEFIDVEHHAVIYAAADDDDISDPAVWRKCNPAMGEIISEAEFRSHYLSSINSIHGENQFRRYKLNQWVKPVRSVTWSHLWPDLATAPPDDLAALPCWAGLDLAYANDWTAFVQVWRAGERYYVRPRFWISQENYMRRVERGNVPIAAWLKAGWLTVTPGDATDYPTVEREIMAAIDGCNLRELAFDKFNAMQMSQNFMAAGVTTVEFPQKALHLTTPIKELERLVKSGLIGHDGNPVLNWMTANALVVASNELLRFEKESKDSLNSIDGVVAMAMALGRALLVEESKTLKFITL